MRDAANAMQISSATELRMLSDSQTPALNIKVARRLTTRGKLGRGGKRMNQLHRGLCRRGRR
jgi:hypothetical protein